MGLVKCLGYIGIGANDLDAWREFATDVLGLQIGETPPNDGDGDGDETLYLRMDSRAYRIAVERGEPGALHYLGFEVGTQAELEELATGLVAKGHVVSEEPASVCAARRVNRMISTNDPGQNRIEFIVGHEEATNPFVSPTGAQFVIDDMGLGHAFLLVPEIEHFLEYYVGALGFRLSDTISFGPMMAYFLHCNPRHHSIAGAAVPGISGLGHIMLQVDSIDTVGRAYDRLAAGGHPIEMTLGKHTNDHMISFYCKAQSGLVVEYGIDGRRVNDDTWVVGHYTSASYWGHQHDMPTPAAV